MNEYPKSVGGKVVRSAEEEKALLGSEEQAPAAPVVESAPVAEPEPEKPKAKKGK